MPVELVTSKATPPGGVVTLELRSATTGRLRHRVRTENALMSWYEALIFQNNRRGNRTPDDFASQVSNYGSEGAGFDPFRRLSLDQPALTEPVWAGFTKNRTAWFPWNVSETSATWFWGSPANVAVNTATMEIPTTDTLGEVTGGAYLGSSFTSDGVQNKRGTVSPGGCSWTWSQQRVQATFGASVGNGVYRSVGLGSLQPQQAAPGGLRAARAPMCTGNVTDPQLGSWYRLNGQLHFGTRIARGRDGSNAMFVTDEAGDSISYWDVDDISWAGGGLTYQGQVAAPGAGGYAVVVDTASDFWVLRSGVLYRCDTRPPAAINVVNTYDLSASFSGTLGTLDMCFDGTDLRIIDDTSVHTVSTTTGGITGSFAHSLTASGTNDVYSIEWNAATSELYVNVGSTDPGVDEQWGGLLSQGQFAWNGTGDDAVVHRFTSAGSKVGAYMGVHGTGYTDEQGVFAQVQAMDHDGVISLSCHEIDSSSHQIGMHAPSMATHALLGADLTKTVADVLTVTYDFNYA